MTVIIGNHEDVMFDSHPPMVLLLFSQGVLIVAYDIDCETAFWTAGCPGSPGLQIKFE